MMSATCWQERRRRMKKPGIDWLIRQLKLLDNIVLRTVLVESYIQQYGPIPDEYEQEIRELLYA